MVRNRNSTSYQEGSIERVRLAKGLDQWTYRWWEISKQGDRRIHRRKLIGTVETYPTIGAAKRAVDGFRTEINAATTKSVRMTVGEAWGHFQANELRDPDVDRSPTTIKSYLDYFKSRILP